MIEEVLENLMGVEEGFEIVEEDFKMIFDGHYAFDLFFKNKKGDWKLQGYNIPLANCIQRILYNRINIKYNSLDLKTFLNELSQMNHNLYDLLISITQNGIKKN